MKKFKSEAFEKASPKLLICGGAIVTRFFQVVPTASVFFRYTIRPSCLRVFVAKIKWSVS